MPLLLHRINFDLTVLKQDGCQLTDPPELFKALMASTMADPCKAGCYYFNHGQCSAYKKHHSEQIDKREEAKSDYVRSHSDGLIGGKWKGMTSKQIRKEEGISPNEFQKRKQEGRYAR